MEKMITRFRSNDGHFFDTEEARDIYNHLEENISFIMGPLGDVPVLAHSYSYAQHDIYVVDRVFKKFVDLCLKMNVIPKHMIDLNTTSFKLPILINSYVKDCSISLLSKAANRLHKISIKTGREYSSYSFVMNEF